VMTETAISSGRSPSGRSASRAMKTDVSAIARLNVIIDQEFTHGGKVGA
jgi:hypothetical protein